MILGKLEVPMAEDTAEVRGFGTGTAGGEELIRPSIWNALPYFIPLSIFPLVVMAAIKGGWWLAGPFFFLWLADNLDAAFGTEERNLDPKKTRESQLFWYKLAVWVWVALYPITLVFALWQILVAERLVLWEAVLMVLALGSMARLTLNAGHDMMHRRAIWERWIGEFLMASVSFPQEVTEHVYIHHAHIGTPKDAVSAPRGQSFWQYLPRSVARSYLDTWRFERDWLARRHLPVWHYTNPVWRYFLGVAAWYGLAYWIGGVWGLLVLAVICILGIFQLRVVDYVQHYGLQRIRLPGGRFERVQPRHSWSAAYRFSNWLYYNAQRHADHHMVATRLYALLQHSGGDKAPQLPGTYAKAVGLALFPRRWFQAMDPLVDTWRTHFYPQIDDWRPYDSPAFAARPEAFEAIAEIIDSAPRLAAWINHAPELLDNLKEREFTDLDLPDGFGPDPEFEKIARRGLARVYWTREFGVSEMKEQIADFPIQDSRDAVETARIWSNDKVFQVGVHMMRGNLSPIEAGMALSHVAEASIAAVLSASAEDFGDPLTQGGVAGVILGDLASGEAVPGADLDVLFLHDGGSTDHAEALCRRFHEALRTLCRDNLLFAMAPRDRAPRAVRSLAEFREHHRTAASAGELQELFRARCVFAAGDPVVGTRFDEARREILTHGVAREALMTALRETGTGTTEPDPGRADDTRGGLRDVESAALLLQLIHAEACPDVLVSGAASAFRTLGARGLIPADAAERMEASAKTWRNLRGILSVVLEDGSPVETADARVKAVIARSCGVDDYSGLAEAIRQTASSAAAGIAALNGMKT
ncbi:MAG: fatty acid desaturase [Nitrospira sp.]|nr:fatty acid desaturase [Nitrospira sp.]